MAVATVIDLESLPAILTLKHVQDILGISRQTAFNIARRPGFPLLRLDKKTLRIRRDAFLSWLEQQAGKAGATSRTASREQWDRDGICVD